MSNTAVPSAFRFRTTDSIGAAAAEDDDEFLDACFVDTGTLRLLENMGDRRLIVLGRTGAGKSALLAKLERLQPGRVVRISPEHLALTYVANSTILTFFSTIGVNLDPFFKLLWRHVLTVEILTHHFQQAAEPRPLLERLKGLFSGGSRHDKDMRQAIKYLEDWGSSFWQDTEFRVKEITSLLETQLDAELKATLGVKAASVGSAIKSADRFSESEKSELVSRGQDIITKAQVQDLHKVLRLLDSVLNDKQRCYYLIVDGLDENWVEERLRYKLIMALMQTARDFNEVRHAKVVVALRRDLVERVFRLTRDSGFQEEKYQSLYLPLVWKKDQILDLLDKRIGFLVTRRYAGATKVTHRDVLPREFRGKPIGEYIYSMAPRPRDVIAYFNTCIGAASNHAKLGAKELRLAEGEYSRKRVSALADEWSSDYPTLIDFAAILQKRPSSFKVGSVSDDEVSELCLRIAAANVGGTGLTNAALQVVEGPMPVKHFLYLLVRTFYQVGLVGLKLAPHETESWVDELGRSVSFPEINDQTSVVVHPAYRRALGVRES
jgi:hypothetical protein